MTTYDERTLTDPTTAAPVLAQRTAAPGLAVPASVRHDPSWTRWALVALLVGTAGLYLWSLDTNGWANSYYTAAAQAGSVSWKAWFFGSFDAANSITVDKPPAALWIMGLSVRAFGLNSWAILVPQALMGVASVWLVFATVRRWFSAQAGLIAGLVLALTPVATLMFRFNNPDALLVLLLVAAAYSTTRAIESGSWRWLALAGALVGFGFLSKMMQAFLVLPGFVAAYGVAADITLRRRIKHLFAAFATMIVTASWWVAIVELWPADSRPYIGGSQTNSVLELIFGYNGFGRLTGDETGSVVGGGAGMGGGAATSMWGETGFGRLFSASYGGQIAWLLPAAILGFAIMFWLSRKAPRTDRTRAAAIIWGGWLLVTAAAISFGQGIIHEYYSVALAPAIGIGVGVGSWLLWQRREQLWARSTLAAAVLLSAGWGIVLLQRSPEFAPGLSWLVGLAALIAAAGLVLAPSLGSWVVSAAAVAGLAAVLAGPLSYSLATVSQPATGSLPSAGPVVAGAGMGLGGMPGGGPGGLPAGGPGGMPGLAQQFPGGGGFPQQQGGRPSFPGGGQQGPGGPPGGGTGGQPGGGGTGGLLEATTPSAAVTAALLENADSYTWVMATTGSQSAAGYQIATQRPVMPIGGFNGTDPSPTLEQFKLYVNEGQIHYYLAGGGGGPGRGAMGSANGGSQSASEIQEWVVANFTTVQIDGVTFYDLTQPTSAGVTVVQGTVVA